MTDAKSKITSLRDLPQSVQPPRDLWAGIEAQIKSVEVAPENSVGAAPPVRRSAPLHWLAAAAMVAALAVGVWIGRASLPTIGPSSALHTQGLNQNQRPGLNQGQGPTQGQGPGPGQTQTNADIVQAAYLADPKFRAQRAALVKSLDSKLTGLPPESRAKVVASLQAIHKSMQDLEAALGKDPANALLQELLMNTYQDEMRVLTTVDEASQSGRGI